MLNRNKTNQRNKKIKKGMMKASDQNLFLFIEDRKNGILKGR
ncbi:hypothetical protein KR50_07610 [Jeotgalibacillus campisalis]|uniref:Uncharacterized protein n=1 Tax=Jeotgalibacillus campisalis TaxID=220754 RepID=A0A0C2RKV9_9BACL|nr:hypothetical protein KR50_07610 [Jeotgalibacillus campisalis]